MTSDALTPTEEIQIRLATSGPREASNINESMGTAIEPKLQCLVDQFVRCVPSNKTGQQIKLTTFGGHARIIPNQEVVAEKLKYYQRFFPFRLEEKPKNEILFARVYLYWPPGIGRGKTMGLEDRVLKTTKPDADNAAKLFLDAIAPLFFDDDCRIANLEVQKTWSKRPGVYFGLWKAI